VTGAGCDVEVAAVTVGDVEGWTFAFAAFCPPATRQDALLAPWQGLVAATPCPEPFGPRTGREMGYLEWLTCTIAPVVRPRRRHRPPTADLPASSR
jgi:hypothetical protein